MQKKLFRKVLHVALKHREYSFTHNEITSTFMFFSFLKQLIFHFQIAFPCSIFRQFLFRLFSPYLFPRVLLINECKEYDNLFFFFFGLTIASHPYQTDTLTYPSAILSFPDTNRNNRFLLSLSLSLYCFDYWKTSITRLRDTNTPLRYAWKTLLDCSLLKIPQNNRNEKCHQFVIKRKYLIFIVFIFYSNTGSRKIDLSLPKWKLNYNVINIFR